MSGTRVSFLGFFLLELEDLPLCKSRWALDILGTHLWLLDEDFCLVGVGFLIKIRKYRFLADELEEDKAFLNGEARTFAFGDDELLLTSGFFQERSPKGARGGDSLMTRAACRFRSEVDEEDLDGTFRIGFAKSMPPGGATGALIWGGPPDWTELLGA